MYDEQLAQRFASVSAPIPPVAGSTEEVAAQVQGLFARHALAAAGKIVDIALTSEREVMQLNACKFVVSMVMPDKKTSSEADPLTKFMEQIQKATASNN